MSICSELRDTLETLFDELGDLLEGTCLFDEEGDRRNAPLRQEPVLGDIIGVDRGIYQHYGIYAGDDKVIHYTSDASDLDPENAVIQETSLERFLRDESEYFILEGFEICSSGEAAQAAEKETQARRKKTAGKKPAEEEGPVAFTPEEVVERAQSRMGERNYNLLVNNCEHFAVWCKTGISDSKQVRKWVDLCRRILIDA